MVFVSSKDLTEGFILDSYFANGQAPELPLLWQILYHEGMRSNHLLFSKEEVESFDFSPGESISEDEKSTLETVASEMFKSSDLSAMKRSIAGCSPRIKKNLFVIYQNFLFGWGKILRNSLN